MRMNSVLLTVLFLAWFIRRAAQFTSSIALRLPLHASQPTPKIHNATALLTHS